jgi:hypothetical protein
MLIKARIENLLQTTDVAAVAEFYFLFDELIALRRSTSSDIDFDGINTLSLRALMSLYKVKTIIISYKIEEEVEAQWLYRAHARYVSRGCSLY